MTKAGSSIANRLGSGPKMVNGLLTICLNLSISSLSRGSYRGVS
jgi:hypothetical protein